MKLVKMNKNYFQYNLITVGKLLLLILWLLNFKLKLFFLKATHEIGHLLGIYNNLVIILY